MTRNMASMRRQHDALTEILLRLVNMVDRYRGGPDAYPIAVQLARLVSLLRSHLASEDEWLYPAMVAAHEPGAAALAFGFRAEMGGLASKLEEFERLWSSSSAIAASFDAFRSDARILFVAIDERIAREDAELYPAADRLGIGQVSNAA